MPNNADLPAPKSESNPSAGPQLAAPSNQLNQPAITIGQAKELWSEVMFYLALFFGLLHFAGLLMQIIGMFMHATLHKEPGWSFTSSLLMSNLYLAFLTAYVGGKEFVRWFRRKDDEILSTIEAKKISRGVWIVIGWAVFTGLVVFGWQMGLIAEVPNTLLFTLAEVVTLFCGTEASKYIRNQQAGQAKQDKQNKAEYKDRIVAYCREKGSITSGDCQREFGLDKDQANYVLGTLVKEKILKAQGVNKARRYVLP